jgi:hypothetical protein
MRGVPRERRAISEQPLGSSSTPRIFAERLAISSRNFGS